MPIVSYYWFFYIQTPEIWGEIYPKNAWKWPKIITSMKWFKTFIYFYIVWNILFNFHHNTYQIYALMLMLLDSRNSWWKYWKTLKTPKKSNCTNGTEKDIYSDVVQVLRYTKRLVSFLHKFCLALTQNWLVCTHVLAYMYK